MISIRDLANRELLDLVPYEPGKPIDDVARELGLEPSSIIKLASNENPLGPSPKAVEAMLDALTQVHIYPDGGGYHLRTALAEKLGLARENVVIGNGSNEIIELMFHSFTRPGVHDIITARNAFVVYKLMAQLFGVRAIEVPDRGFVPDLRAMRAAITPQTRLLFIASPNNPTGTRVPNEDLEELIDNLPDHVIAVMDEAYFEFMDSPPDSLAWVKKGKKVVLMRTFSKIQGLAGLRIGYGLASAELAGILQRARQPFNTNSLAQVGALAALQDQEHQDKTKRITDEGRARMEQQFAAWGLSYVPSAANFVLVDVGDGDAVFKKLMKLGIIVRSMVSYRLPSYIRVSIGTPEQNERFLRELPGVMDRPLASPASVAAEAEVARTLAVEGASALGSTAELVGEETAVSDPPYIQVPLAEPVAALPSATVAAPSEPVAATSSEPVAANPAEPVAPTPSETVAEAATTASAEPALAMASEAASEVDASVSHEPTERVAEAATHAVLAAPEPTPPPLPIVATPADSLPADSSLGVADAEPLDSMTPRLLEEERKAEPGPTELTAAPTIPLLVDEEERVAAAVAHEEDVQAGAPAHGGAPEFEEVPIITSNLIGLVPEAPGEKILDDEPRHAYATGLVPTPREVVEAISELAAEAPVISDVVESAPETKADTENSSAEPEAIVAPASVATSGESNKVSADKPDAGAVVGAADSLGAVPSSSVEGSLEGGATSPSPEPSATSAPVESAATPTPVETAPPIPPGALPETTPTAVIETTPIAESAPAAAAEEPHLPLVGVTPLLTPYEEWHASPALTAPHPEETDAPPALYVPVPHDEMDELLPEGNTLTPLAESVATLPPFEPLLSHIPHETGDEFEEIRETPTDDLEGTSPAAPTAIGDAPPLPGGESVTENSEALPLRASTPEANDAPPAAVPAATPVPSAEGHGHGRVAP